MDERRVNGWMDGSLHGHIIKTGGCFGSIAGLLQGGQARPVQCNASVETDMAKRIELSCSDAARVCCGPLASPVISLCPGLVV